MSCTTYELLSFSSFFPHAYIISDEIATGEGHAEVVEILLKAGADRSYRGQPGTALEVARAKKLNEIIKLLTEKPAATGGSR
jgi:ankyrin repeat protein